MQIPHEVEPQPGTWEGLPLVDDGNAGGLGGRDEEALVSLCVQTVACAGRNAIRDASQAGTSVMLRSGRLRGSDQGHVVLFAGPMAALPDLLAAEGMDSMIVCDEQVNGKCEGRTSTVNSCCS